MILFPPRTLPALPPRKKKRKKKLQGLIHDREAVGLTGLRAKVHGAEAQPSPASRCGQDGCTPRLLSLYDTKLGSNACSRYGASERHRRYGPCVTLSLSRVWPRRPQLPKPSASSCGQILSEPPGRDAGVGRALGEPRRSCARHRYTNDTARCQRRAGHGGDAARRRHPAGLNSTNTGGARAWREAVNRSKPMFDRERASGGWRPPRDTRSARPAYRARPG